MNPLAVVFIGIGSALLGLAIGWAMHAHVSRAIEAENRELRQDRVRALPAARPAR